MKLVLPIVATPTLALLVLAFTACADRGPGEPRAAATEQAAVEDRPATNAITFEGFGSARFGDDAQAVRRAWGGELDGAPRQSSACHYLIPPIEPGRGYAIAFMIENGKFVRIDVAREGIVAPGGGRIGMSADKIESLYRNVQRQKHKYVEGGHYLRAAGANGDGVLVFETNADGVVTAWRIGVPPQVDYIEGCS